MCFRLLAEARALRMSNCLLVSVGAVVCLALLWVTQTLIFLNLFCPKTLKALCSLYISLSKNFLRCVFTLNGRVLTYQDSSGTLPRPKSSSNRKTVAQRQTERHTERGGKEKKPKKRLQSVFWAWLMAPGCWAEFRVGGRALEGGTMSSGLGRRWWTWFLRE